MAFGLRKPAPKMREVHFQEICETKVTLENTQTALDLPMWSSE